MEGNPMESNDREGVEMENHGNVLDAEQQEPADLRSYTLPSFDSESEFDPSSGGPPPGAGLGTDSSFRPEVDQEVHEGEDFDESDRTGGGEETDFASLKFQRENTLLTNAENYAASVREEAELYVRQLRGEVESLNGEAEKRYEEAATLKAEAEAEAERKIAEAEARVEEIRLQAHGEGFQAGREEGAKQRYAELAPQLEHLESLLEQISDFSRQVAYYTEKDGVRLALLIARRILHSEVRTNRQALARMVASALSKLDGQGRFRVWVHPDDHAFMVQARRSLERYLDEEQSLTLRARQDVAPGNALIETDREVIDLTFESQFFHLERQINQTLAERETEVVRQGGKRTAGKNTAGNGPAAKSTAAPSTAAKSTAAKSTAAKRAGSPATAATPKASAKGAAQPAAKPTDAPSQPREGDGNAE